MGVSDEVGASECSPHPSMACLSSMVFGTAPIAVSIGDGVCSPTEGSRMSQRLPLGRMAVGRREEPADSRFAPVEFSATNSRLTGSPGCQHLFEISDLEDEAPFEVEAIDIIEPADEPLEPASRCGSALAE